MTVDGGGALARDETLRALGDAKRGRAEGFRRLYELLGPAVAAYCRGQRVPDPDDLVNEIFLRVFRNLPAFEGGLGQLRSWVFAIAHNLCVDEQRRSRARPRVVPLGESIPDVADASFEGSVLDHVSDTAVKSALRRLSGDQQQVLLLRSVVGLSVRETATAIGKQPAAVKGLHRRAISAMRQHLEAPAGGVVLYGQAS